MKFVKFPEMFVVDFFLLADGGRDVKRRFR